MAKSRPAYRCGECGAEALAWAGRCPGCGAWNSLQEVTAAPAARRGAGAGPGASAGAAPEPVRLRDVEASREARLETGIAELDRVLGGGLVPGSMVLLGGAPGIGKSTLTAMALANLAASGQEVLYVSGEESAAQVRLRAERLGEAALEVPILAEPALDRVLAALEAGRPIACVVDSIQALHAGEGGGVPGSMGQVREAAAALLEAAKRGGAATILVGHVTKDGALAGPRALEHLVDCVLHFEGERERSYRTLRAIKNRFGATSEVGVFEMRSGGLVEVADPSARFVAEARPAPGSCLLCAMEGTRPVLVEVQALVAPSEAEHPRRVAAGIDRNRLALILAVLSRHAGIALGRSDVFVSVAGGVRVEEPGADLAVALALASAQSGRALGRGERPLACFGELGLGGELRHVAHPDRRLAEVGKFGLGDAIGPAGGEDAEGLLGCSTLAEALAAVGGSKAGRAPGRERSGSQRPARRAA